MRRLVHLLSLPLSLVMMAGFLAGCQGAITREALLSAFAEAGIAYEERDEAEGIYESTFGAEHSSYYNLETGRLVIHEFPNVVERRRVHRDPFPAATVVLPFGMYGVERFLLFFHRGNEDLRHGEEAVEEMDARIASALRTAFGDAYEERFDERFLSSVSFSAEGFDFGYHLGDVFALDSLQNSIEGAKREWLFYREMQGEPVELTLHYGLNARKVGLLLYLDERTTRARFAYTNEPGKLYVVSKTHTEILKKNLLETLAWIKKLH